MTIPARAGASPTLTLTRPLLQWLRDDPAWARLSLSLRARLTWLASLGSLNARLGDTLQRSDGNAPLHDPVLVVGPWRSGTTVMHELLVAATHGAAPRTWQCMNAAAFCLGRPPADQVVAARPMDGLPIAARSPQEDEFALLTVGVDSAYRAFWMPHRIGELHHTLDPAHWLGDAGWLARWESLLASMLVHQGPGARQPMILKSPNHTWRLPAILRRFPAARVVWMARDPGQVLQSNRAMWNTMFRLHGLTPGEPLALDAFLEHALGQAAQVLRSCAQRLPPAQLVVVSHQQLLADPAGTTGAALRRLSLPCDTVALADALLRVAGGRVERHPQPAPSPVTGALRVAQAEALHSRGLPPA